ncbi:MULTISPECIES: galactose ABC transporter substrate-binding protein [Clostridium]|uniref:galactose ABC transporter substrate-binding protein n=1 Tax=Clostridium TaxID=1485 RepID=UPI002943EB33|nr:MULTISPECIES: galactose ABC transporter substrate-binding protein [unclassified Clostridium]
MKRISIFSILIIIIISIFKLDVSATVINKNPIKVGVLLYRGDTNYLSQVKSELLKIENENNDKIDYLFYDANASQELQNRQIDELINMKVDLILLNIVDIQQADSIISKIKETNTPLIVFNREPLSLNEIKAYNKSLYVGTESCDAGRIKSQMIINEIRSGNIKDKNKNDAIDYVLLEGDVGNIEATLRSECVIRALNDNKIRTNMIAEQVCNWEQECAKEKTKDLFSKYGDNIEVIISNNDDMAIGAVRALQESGYNMGDPNKFISVVGVGGSAEAIEMIDSGFMTGTVFHDPKAKAIALYKIGLNLANGKEPLKDTEYEFDRTGVAVRIPFNGYITRNQSN